MQQLANMALEGSKERRYFQGVAGDRTQKGELFGYNNLWPLRKPGQPGLNLTLDLLKVKKCMVEVSLGKIIPSLHINSPPPPPPPPPPPLRSLKSSFKNLLEVRITL